MRNPKMWLAMMAAVTSVGCTEAPTGAEREAVVLMNFLTPATVRTVVVEVSGPGVTPAVVVNLPVGADSTARDTLRLTAGAGRRFVVSALDSAGVKTHRADTTVTLQSGMNTALTMRLDPLQSQVGITVTFGGVRLTVSDTSTRMILVSETLSVVASAVLPDGSPVPLDSLRWGSSNPAVATVSANGVVTAVRAGTASIAVSYRGASAWIPISVQNGGMSSAITTDGLPNSGASGMITLGSFGKPQVFSISFWFKPVTDGARHQVLLDASHSGSTNWVFQYLGVASSNMWCFTTACVELPSAIWYHVMLTYDNGSVKFFVNGTLRETANSAINYSATAPTLYLGNWPVGSRQFAGALDNLYITTDLQQVANFTPPVAIGTPSSNLFGLWRFEEGTGAETANSAGTALGLGIWTWTTRPF